MSKIDGTYDFPPVCLICGTPMVNGYDSISKEISKYLWVHNCKCSTMTLLIG